MTDIPSGIFPINIRGVTCQKYGLKFGDGASDYVKHQYISKDEIVKEIQMLGVMSDFEPVKKLAESFIGEQILFIVDLTEKYGEMILMCYTKEAEESYLAEYQREEDLKREQELLVEEANKPIDMSHIVYEEKPFIPHVWNSDTSSITIQEIKEFNYVPKKVYNSISISRPKRTLKQPIKFTDNCVISHKIKSQYTAYNTTINTMSTTTTTSIRMQEADNGFQVIPPCQTIGTQTMYHKPSNKAIQYESQSMSTQTLDSILKDEYESNQQNLLDMVDIDREGTQSVEINDDQLRQLHVHVHDSSPLLSTSNTHGRRLSRSSSPSPSHHTHTHTHSHTQKNSHHQNPHRDPISMTSTPHSRFMEFLKKTSSIMEQYLLQNESIEIFHSTFEFLKLQETEYVSSNTQLENDLKEIKNFADPTYTKSKMITAMEWVPYSTSHIVVSPIRNLPYTERLHSIGQSQNAYIVLWDFKQLVKPGLVMKSPSEVLALKFNKSHPQWLIGGCMSGQVVLWELATTTLYHTNTVTATTNTKENTGVDPSHTNTNITTGTTTTTTTTTTTNGSNTTTGDKTHEKKIANNISGGDDTQRSTTDDSNVIPGLSSARSTVNTTNTTTNPINSTNTNTTTTSSNPNGTINPKYISAMPRSHKKPVTDIVWLPAHIQLNYQGQLVTEDMIQRPESSDGHNPPTTNTTHTNTTTSTTNTSAHSNTNTSSHHKISYQFISISSDGMLLLWDVRYEQIFNDELKHIARSKHILHEKLSVKEGGHMRPLWSPIFAARLKRLEGVGEVSLCKLSYQTIPMNWEVSPRISDSPVQLLCGTEEGDVLLANVVLHNSSHSTGDSRQGTRPESNTNTTAAAAAAASKAGSGTGGTAGEGEEEEEGSSKEYVKWMIEDHSRPAVALQHAPFFPDILLTVSDWKFNIWKICDNKPLFSSPLSTIPYTCGCWSPTRPSVLYLGCQSGAIEVWDFLDSSTNASIKFHATTPVKLTSMEFLLNHNSSSSSSTSHSHVPGASATHNTNTQKSQLLACGDEAGTLHIFEIPRTLVRAENKEEKVMETFLKRLYERRVEDMTSMMNTTTTTTTNDNTDRSTAASTSSRNETAMSMFNRTGYDTSVNTILNYTIDDTIITKEEEEYALLEQKFIQDLNLFIPSTTTTTTTTSTSNNVNSGSNNNNDTDNSTRFLQ